MRQKKQIAELETRKAAVAFPRAEYGPTSFDRFHRNLREVLAENGLGSGWEYDPDSGDFYCEISEGAALGGFRGAMSVVLTLDLGKLMAEEISRLIDEKQRFRAACAVSVRDYEQRRKEVR